MVLVATKWTLEQWSQSLTWGLSLLWLGMIVWCWYRARHHARRLMRHEEVLNISYRQDASAPKPFFDPLTHLQAEGWKASEPLSRYDMISYWRATAQTDKQRMSSYIEMMPQLGLLGTVVSLFLSAFLFEFNIATLGLALATTVFGLVGALLARARLELPTEAQYFNILELLQNEQVVSRLVEMVAGAGAVSEVTAGVTQAPAQDEAGPEVLEAAEAAPRGEDALPPGA